MLTKYKNVKTFRPEKERISSLKMFHVRGVFTIFFIREGASNFVTFSSAFFPAGLMQFE